MTHSDRAASVDRAAAALAAVAVLTVLIHLLIPLPSDVSWLIVVNERLWDGERLYADILETNPPMASWLYALPVALERLTGLRAETGVVLETVLAGLAALLLAIWSLGHRAPLLPLTLAAAAILLLPIDDFAQREHFALFGLLPALAVAMRRSGNVAPSTGMIIAAGVGEALMIAIKPHFALVILALAVTVAVQRRWLRALVAAEHLLALALVLIYAASIAAFYPSYLSDILPAVGRLYVPLHMDIVPLLLAPHTLLACFAIVALAWFGKRTQPSAPLVLVVIVACFAVYAIQAKGFAYHLLPGDTLSVLALLALAAQPLRPLAIRLALWTVLGIVAAVPAITGLVIALTRPEPLLAPLAGYGPGRTLLVISSDIGLGNPLSRQLDDRLVGSSPMLWRATGAILLSRNASADQQQALAADMDAEHRSLAADLRQRQPDIVLADTSGFDWLTWARSDPETAALLDDYVIEGQTDTHNTTVAILLRRPGP